jgi:hypothetical protein
MPVGAGSHPSFVQQQDTAPALPRRARANRTADLVTAKDELGERGLDLRGGCPHQVEQPAPPIDPTLLRSDTSSHNFEVPGAGAGCGSRT